MSHPQVLRALTRLELSDHLCWLYADQAELQSALAACAQAAASRQAPLYLLAEGDLAEPAQVHRLGLAPGDPRPQVHQALTQVPPATPAPWLVADLTPAASLAADPFLTWLASLWQQAAARPLQLIELYDARRVPAELAFELLRGHNRLVYEGQAYANEAAVMPPGGCESMGDPRQRCQRFLANLQRWSAVHAELEERLDELRAFQAIARAVNRSLSLEEVLQAALEQIVALTRADLGHIALWHEPSNKPLCCAVRGAPPDLVRQLERDPLWAGLARRVRGLGHSMSVADGRRSPFRRQIPRSVVRAGFVSFLVMSLRARDGVRGAIFLGSREPTHFRTQDAALLESLSEQIDVALDNAWLYTQARRRAEEMSSLYELGLAAASLDPDDILRLIGERIARLFNTSCYFVALLDEEQGALHFAHALDQWQPVPPFTIPLTQDTGLSGHVLRTAQPLLIEDLAARRDDLPVAPIHVGQAARSWLGVPLVVKGRAIGVVNVQSYQPAAFDEDDLRLLSLAAQLAAAALENARLFQRTLALERRYHKLLEELNDGYAVLQEGRVVFANARLGRMLGASPGALLASSLEELHVEEERRTGKERWSWLLESGPDSMHYRTRFLRRDGTALPVEVTLNRIEYEGGPALAMLCRDISSQVRLEAQLLQAEKLSAVGQLVAGVAHELNNPLTTIKGYAQLLQGERLPAPVRADLARVEEAADRCRRIVGDLLTFARRYEPQRTETDVNDLLERTVALRSYELRVRNVAVQWDLDPLLPTIQADPHRLQQVILNLIFNAEHAVSGLHEGGRITIRSRALPDGQHIRFEVADNGPGIRPEHIDRLFDPFFTTKEVGSGTGLGLSISYGIVRDHGGRIWVESEFGCGATFCVELPLLPPTGPHVDPQPLPTVAE